MVGHHSRNGVDIDLVVVGTVVQRQFHGVARGVQNPTAGAILKPTGADTPRSGGHDG